MEMRRVGAHLLKINKRYAQAIDISKKDALYQDAIETAAVSGDRDVVESLIRFFTDNKLHECFAACLFTCYEYVKPDVVLELAWRHKINDFAMPYIIQVLKEYTDKVDDVVGQLKEAKDSAEQTVNAVEQAQMQQNLMITSGPAGMPMQQQMAPQYG